MKQTLLAFIILIGFISCEQSKDKPLTQDEMNKIIEDRTSELKKVLQASDVKGLMALYDDNTAVSIDGFSALRGKVELEKFLSNGMKMTKFSKLDMKTELVKGNREYIYQMGIMKSQIRINDSIFPEEEAKFFYLWKLQDDNSYKIAVEMSNNANEDQD